MRVLFLTHNFPRHPGDPAGSFILRLAVALRDEGIAVHVLTPHARGLAMDDAVEGIGVTRFRYAPDALETLAYGGTMAEQVRGGWRGLAAMGGLLSAAAAQVARAARDADVVHAHWWFPSGAAAAFAPRGGAPLVTTMHGSDVRLARGIRAAQRPMRWTLRRSAATTAVSRWLAEEAEALTGVLPDVEPMPVAVHRFTPPPAGMRVTDRLLFVGRLNAQKGAELLLGALRELPGLTADIVGDGPDRAQLVTRAEALGVAGRIRWRGERPHEELPEFYRGASALVVPSTEEGLGLVAVEAHLCGLPVVAFDSGGLRDVVIDGVTGVVARDRSPSGIARAVSTLLARPDGGAALAGEGRRRALERFAPGAVARRYRAIYERVLVAHRG
ncbi:MAG: glycosyltransferase [Gemmatimonadaceae bacterium]